VQLNTQFILLRVAHSIQYMPFFSCTIPLKLGTTNNIGPISIAMYNIHCIQAVKKVMSADTVSVIQLVCHIGQNFFNLTACIAARVVHLISHLYRKAYTFCYILNYYLT
jgi:hypothetical protein